MSDWEQNGGGLQEMWSRVAAAAPASDPTSWAGTYASDELAAEYRTETAAAGLTADPSPLTPLFGDVFLGPGIGALIFERVGSEAASFRIRGGLSQVVFRWREAFSFNR